MFPPCDKKSNKKLAKYSRNLSVKVQTLIFSHAPPFFFFAAPSNLRKFFFSLLLSAVCAPSTGPRQEKSPGERRKSSSSPVTTVTGCAGRPRRGAKICLWEGRPATWATTTPPRSTQPPVSTARERERESFVLIFFAVRPGARRPPACRRVLPGEGQARDRALATLLAAGGLGPAAKPPVGQGLRRQSVGESESARM